MINQTVCLQCLMNRM